MPKAPRVTYADRVNDYLCKKTNLNAFNIDDVVEEIVQMMEARGVPVTRYSRGCIRTYFKNLSIQRDLLKHPSGEGLVQPSERFREAIERIRESEVNIEDADITRISSLLRVAVGRMRKLTARELRDRVLELLDENDDLRAENNALKKMHEELQVDYDIALEERDEWQKENSSLKAENTDLRARIAELQAASSGGSATPLTLDAESTSPDADGYQTAPSSPQLGPQQPAGTLSRVPTETIPPVTPQRAPVSRNPSGLPTPPTTDARRPLGPRASRTGSRASVGSHRSFGENSPGAASVRGATPGSPSRRPHRHSPPLRRLSTQNSNQDQAASSSGAGLPPRAPSFSAITNAYDGSLQLAYRQCDERCADIMERKEQAMQLARAQHDEQVQREELAQRTQALENERSRLREELAKVHGELEELREQHRTKSREYEDLYAHYNKLRTRVGTLTGALNDCANEAAALVKEHGGPVVGATTSGAA